MLRNSQSLVERTFCMNILEERYRTKTDRMHNITINFQEKMVELCQKKKKKKKKKFHSDLFFFDKIKITEFRRTEYITISTAKLIL